MPDMNSTSAGLTGGDAGGTVSRRAARVPHAPTAMIPARLKNPIGLMMPENLRAPRGGPPAFVLQRGPLALRLRHQGPASVHGHRNRDRRLDDDRRDAAIRRRSRDREAAKAVGTIGIHVIGLSTE